MLDDQAVRRKRVGLGLDAGIVRAAAASSSRVVFKRFARSVSAAAALLKRAHASAASKP